MAYAAATATAEARWRARSSSAAVTNAPSAGGLAADAGVATLEFEPPPPRITGRDVSDPTRAGVAGALPARFLGGDIHGGISPADGAPSSSSSEMVLGTAGPAPTGLLIMRRTYCARTASRARAAAPMTASLRALAWSARRCAARFSRTCSGVSPEGSAARHMGQVLKSASRHRTRQHRWKTCAHSVVKSSRLASSTSGSHRPSRSRGL